MTLADAKNPSNYHDLFFWLTFSTFFCPNIGRQGWDSRIAFVMIHTTPLDDFCRPAKTVANTKKSFQPRSIFDMYTVAPEENPTAERKS